MQVHQALLLSSNQINNEINLTFVQCGRLWSKARNLGTTGQIAVKFVLDIPQPMSHSGFVTVISVRHRRIIFFLADCHEIN